MNFDWIWLQEMLIDYFDAIFSSVVGVGCVGYMQRMRWEVWPCFPLHTKSFIWRPVLCFFICAPSLFQSANQCLRCRLRKAWRECFRPKTVRNNASFPSFASQTKEIRDSNSSSLRVKLKSQWGSIIQIRSCDTATDFKWQEYVVASESLLFLWYNPLKLLRSSWNDSTMTFSQYFTSSFTFWILFCKCAVKHLQ
jgi:hypothetical protein